MPEEKGKEKTPAEDQDKEDKNKKGEEEDKEEDPFSDLFSDEEEDKEEGEEEEEIEEEEEEEAPKTPKKKVTPKKEIPNANEIIVKQLEIAERRLERRSDANEFLSSDKGKIFTENIKGFGEKFRQAAQSQKYQSVPVSKLPALILTEAAYDKALSDSRKKADDEAADSSTVGGGSRRAVTPVELENVNPLDMSQEEFAKMKENAKRGKYLIKKS